MSLRAIVRKKGSSVGSMGLAPAYLSKGDGTALSSYTSHLPGRLQWSERVHCADDTRRPDQSLR